MTSRALSEVIAVTPQKIKYFNLSRFSGYNILTVSEMHRLQNDSATPFVFG